MSSDEDEDYMSDKYLPKLEAAPGLPKRKQDQRSLDVYKKKLKTKQPTFREREEDARNSGLGTALSSENMGFKMLAKMGYKPGTGLGRTNEGILEPIALKIKNDHTGVGRSKVFIPKKVYAAPDLEKMHTDFRQTLIHKTRDQLLYSIFYKAQKSCYNLDKMKEIEQPKEEFYWPKAVVEQMKSKKKQKTVHSDSDTDSEEECLKSDSELCEDDDADIILDRKGLVTEDNLLSLNDYLREQHFYCVYCGANGVNTDDLNSFCPGPLKEDHDD